MASVELAVLARRARFAYELGMLRRAVVRAWPVPVAAWLAVRLGSGADHVATLAVPLAIAAVVFVWRGGLTGRAVAPGLAAGAVPLIVPGLAMEYAMACSANCMAWCAASCVASGLCAGGLIGFHAARRDDGGWLYGLTAAAVAGATGAMGCSMAGVFGVAGMLAGLAAGAVPLLAWSPRRA